MSDETADTSSAPEAPNGALAGPYPQAADGAVDRTRDQSAPGPRRATRSGPTPSGTNTRPPGAPFIVRLNNEIRGVAVLKAPIDKETGGPKLDGPEVEIERFELAPDELDASHATLFVINNKWRLIFNFQTRRAHAGQLLDKAEEFLATAEWCHAQGKVSACVDNLFSACELTSKAQLIVHHLLEAEFTQAQSHSDPTQSAGPDRKRSAGLPGSVQPTPARAPRAALRGLRPQQLSGRCWTPRDCPPRTRGLSHQDRRQSHP